MRTILVRDKERVEAEVVKMREELISTVAKVRMVLGCVVLCFVIRFPHSAKVMLFPSECTSFDDTYDCFLL